MRPRIKTLFCIALIFVLLNLIPMILRGVIFLLRYI